MFNGPAGFACVETSDTGGGGREDRSEGILVSFHKGLDTLFVICVLSEL